MTQQLPEGFQIEGVESPSELPEGFVIDTPAEQEENLPPELEGQQGVFQSFSEWFSGAGRNTRSMDQLPTIVGSGFLKGANVGDVAKIAMLTSLTNDPNELANIITKQIPTIRVQYNKDAKGDIYPILYNPESGVTAMVDKPGADLMNLGQFATQAAAFTAGGPGKSTLLKGALKVGGQEAAKESVLQGAQAAAGGSFDAGDVAGAAVTGGLFQGGSDLVKNAYMASKGVATEGVQSVVSAAKDLNVPVYSSDIYNPKNWFSRGAQIATEALPVVGTGNMRLAQQEARQMALEDFVNTYRGGSYEEIIESIGAKNKELKDAAGAVYNKVNPYLDQVSQEGGIPLVKAQGKLDELTDYLLTPGREVEDNALNLVDDLQDAFTGGNQSFQVVKDNIGAWQAKMESLDPNSRVNDSKVKAKFKSVLSALREDRDAFAKANLNDQDFNALKKADSVWGEMIEGMSTSKMKSILDKGDVTPEVARNMLFSRNKSDITRLYKSLTPSGQSSARAAFISQIAADLEKTSKGLSPDSFSTAIKRYSDGADVLFTGDRKSELEGLVKVFDATKRAQEVERGSGSQTFERLFGATAVLGGAGGAIPIEGLTAYAGLGAMARFFESPKTRSILTKINGLNPASEEAQALAATFNRMLAGSLQANPLKGTSEYERGITEALQGNDRNQPEEAN